LYVNAATSGYDSVSGAAFRLAAIVQSASTSAAIIEKASALSVVQYRESGFAAARRGKRFIMTGQAPGTLITGGTAFVATAPALMLRINSANYRAIIRSLAISIGNTPGGPVYIAVALDTADRYTSGGGAVTPVNTNEESATATGVLAYDNSVAIVAAAAGATTRYVVNDIISATPGTIYECSFADEILMGPTASTLLVYVWAATTAPQFTYGIDFEDVT
jgi:hypothetical protein